MESAASPLAGQRALVTAASSGIGEAIALALGRAGAKVVANYAHDKDEAKRLAKGGIMMLMKTLAQELAPSRIRVNAIAPGTIRTPIDREAWEQPEALADLLKLVPYGRLEGAKISAERQSGSPPPHQTT